MSKSRYSRPAPLTRVNRRAVLKGATGLGAAALTLGAPSIIRAQDRTIRWLTFWVDQREGFIEPMVNAVSEALGITIEVEYAELGQLMPRLQASLAGGNPPDLVSTLEPDYVALSRAGELLNLKDSIESDAAWSSAIPQSTMDAMDVDGGVFSVALTANAMALYGNRNVIQDAGLSMPQTLDEMYSWPEALGSVTPISYGTGDSWFPMRMFFPIAGQLVGKEYMDLARAGKESWTDDRMLEAFQILLAMKEGGLFPRGVEAVGWQDSKRLFYTAEAASWLFGSWQVPIFRADGIIRGDENPTGLDIQPFLLPSVKDGVSPVMSSSVGSTISVSQSSSNHDVAKEALRFMTTEPGQIIAAQAYNIPAMDGLDLSAVTVAEPYKSFLGFFAANLDKPVPFSASEPAIGTALTNSIQAMMIGSMSPEQAAETVEAARS